jgi:type I restriction enzyme S subunit
MSGLPRGWERLRLKEIAKEGGGSIDPRAFPDETFDLFSIPSFSDGLPERVLGTDIGSTKQLVEQGDVLLSKIVPHIRRVWVVPRADGRRQIASGEWIVYRSSHLEPHFIRLALSERSFRASFLGTVSGVGGSLMRASPKQVAEFSVPVPPLVEQQRIVAKLNTLNAKSSRARAELSRIETLVSRYKQAVLSKAFNGEFTPRRGAEAAIQFNRKLAAQIDGRTPELPALPATWSWVALSSVAEVSGGLTKNSKRDSLPLQVPYLRVANVYANELRLDDVSVIGCTENEVTRTTLTAGDLLLVEGNGSLDQIGRVALWGGELEQCVHQNHLIKVRPSGGLDSKFALYWLLSPSGRRAIEAVAASSSGLHTLSLSKVGGLPLPLCYPEEQDEIVRRIESAFAKIDRLAKEAKRALELVGRLDEALLAKAFRGELVPQDENDEPAEHLLARIRAEREAAPKGKRGRGRSEA